MKKLAAAIATLTLSVSPALMAATSVPIKTRPAAHKTDNGYLKSYIGIHITDEVGSSFYPVVMNKQEQPYLAIKNTLRHWLQLAVTDNTTQITGVIQSTKQTVRFSKLRDTLTKSNGAVIQLPPKAIIYTEGQYWLRYDFWQKWLPVSVNWDLQTYELYFEPTFELFSQLKEEHKRELKQQLDEKTKNERIKKLPAISPTDTFNAQARARVDWTKPTAKDQSLNAQYAGNVDVFGGTFAASGQSMITENGTSSAPGYWSYTLLDKAHFHKIQFGDFNDDQTLLVPALNLNDGVNIARLKNKDLASGFTYQGHTMPNTEINVWHNGILTAVLTADSGGNFTYQDPNGVPGDRYTFHFYFRDGTQANRVIQLAPNDQNLLEPPGTYNVVLQNGYLANNEFNVDTGLASGRVTHAALWYGLTKKVTLGIDAYHLPTPTNSDMGGLDAIWQTDPTWSNLIETLAYKQHTDYAWQSTYTGITNHTLQFQLKQQPLSSPINQLALPLPYTPLSLLPTVLPSASHSWLVKDNYTHDTWDAVSQYRHTNVGDNADIQLNKSLGEHVSLGGTFGLVRPNYNYTDSYKQLDAFYYFNDNSTLSASHTFVTNFNNTSIQFSHYSSGPIGFDYNMGYVKQAGQAYNVFGTVVWRFLPNASISVTAERHLAYLTLSAYGLLAEQPGPMNYDDFASGTVTGDVLAPAPNGGKPVPVKNATVEIGGVITKTDKNGHYFITGLPTDERLVYEVNPNSLSANLIPDKPLQVVYLRPGTDIELDPKIDMTAGVDGQLEHNGPIPKGAKVVIMDKPGGKVIQSADIEPNGFFVINKLKEKRYYVAFTGIKHPPKPKAINLHTKDNWLANLDVNWNTNVG